MNKVLKIYKIFTNIVFYIFMIFTVAYIMNILVCKYVYHEKYSRIFNYYIFSVASGSMEDNIHIGDCIIVEKTSDFEIGDVVTYQKDGYFVTHRIIKIEEDTITTKGDANNTEDEPIDKSDIIGKYVRKSAFIAFLIKYKMIIIEIIAMIIVIGYLIDLTIKKEEKLETKDEEILE